MIERVRKVDPELLSRLEEILKDGMTIAGVAKAWDVHNSTVYYWIDKLGLNLSDIRKVVRLQQLEGPDLDKGLSYYYYVSKATKQGRFTQAERKKALNKFYQNRRRYQVPDSGLVRKLDGK